MLFLFHCALNPLPVRLDPLHVQQPACGVVHRHQYRAIRVLAGVVRGAGFQLVQADSGHEERDLEAGSRQDIEKVEKDK